MARTIREIWSTEGGQSIPEYAVMFALILVLIFGTVRLVGGNVNHALSAVASDLQQSDSD